MVFKKRTPNNSGSQESAQHACALHGFMSTAILRDGCAGPASCRKAGLRGKQFRADDSPALRASAAQTQVPEKNTPLPVTASWAFPLYRK